MGAAMYNLSAPVFARSEFREASELVALGLLKFETPTIIRARPEFFAARSKTDTGARLADSSRQCNPLGTAQPQAARMPRLARTVAR